jgi:CDP-6-deoxy-D-xylo-4-hexulose-3-dehydrase
MNAAFGLVQLGRIEEIRQKRRRIFNRYLENLADCEEILLPHNQFQSDWLAIALMTKDRMNLISFLESQNIQTRVCFAGNITRHPVYRQYLQAFPNADRIMAEGFLLGAHHGMTIEDVDYVCERIKHYFLIQRQKHLTAMKEVMVIENSEIANLKEKFFEQVLKNDDLKTLAPIKQKQNNE